ncbi:MAG: hypothetical protein CME24_09850 [Gemmatimonadetes bacterium]|nr:hypothetical protein [Gemmatimonadota bacterium]
MACSRDNRHDQTLRCCPDGLADPHLLDPRLRCITGDSQQPETRDHDRQQGDDAHDRPRVLQPAHGPLVFDVLSESHAFEGTHETISLPDLPQTREDRLLLPRYYPEIDERQSTFAGQEHGGVLHVDRDR